MSRKIVVVGGVAGGASVAARLRRLRRKMKLLWLNAVNTFHSQTVDCHIILAVSLQKDKNY